MSDRAAKFIRYREERALEDTAFGQGLTPTRLLGVLLPVWCVEIEATILDSEDYRLFDRYVERGIAEGGFSTPAELAEFFGIEQVVAARALRSLRLIGHLAEHDGRLTLTELGLRSLRDGRRYTRTQGDRRKLYFDGHSSHPLTRPYYDSKVVTMWSPAAAAAKSSGDRWPRFHMLVHQGFRIEALADLTRQPDRDLYNLPEQISDPHVVGAPEPVYLPLYIVRATDALGRQHHLAYSQASDTADRHLSRIVGQIRSLVSVLEAEEQEGQSGTDRDNIRRWLDKAGHRGHTPVQQDGAWLVALPPTAFDGSGPLALAKVGSYVMLNGTFVRVWCADESLRRRALLDRIGSYLGMRSRQQTDRANVDHRILMIARQLQLGDIDTHDLQKMASNAGNRTLAAQLTRL